MALPTRSLSSAKLGAAATSNPNTATTAVNAERDLVMASISRLDAGMLRLSIR
jgi:hypothetical protein